jgi:hypothetical protein
VLLVHAPIHAPIHDSWPNQAEIYFSIIRRKFLTTNDFPSLDALAERLLDFRKFAREDLNELLEKLNAPSAQVQ